MSDHDAGGSDGIGAFVQYEGATNGTSVHLYDFDGTSITGEQSIAQTGQWTPGLPGHSYDYFSNFILSSARGVVAFVAQATKPLPSTSPEITTIAVPDTVEGIWFQQSESDPVQLAGFDGQQTPGLAEGVTLDQLRWPAFDKHLGLQPRVEYFISHLICNSATKVHKIGLPFGRPTLVNRVVVDLGPPLPVAVLVVNNTITRVALVGYPPSRLCSTSCQHRRPYNASIIPP
jgi:hypothetical protein